jgi:neurotransmitter:Na+ symporter, NSS family
LMPVLFAILIGLALYASGLDGARAGYAYYLQVDFSELRSLSVLSQAAGQAFFSLSLGMGAMLTYASYLDRDHHLPNESLQVAVTDFLVAFVAGLVVFPLIFAHHLQTAVGESTVGALFITLPTAFAQMGLAGRIVGILFFVALVFAALTSAIALLEQVVATAMDVLGWPRRASALGLGALIFLLGIPAALDLNVLGTMDQLAGNVLLILGSLALSIFVGWVMADPIGEVEAGAPGVRWFFLWRGLLRWVAPPVLAVVLYYSVRTLVGGD